MGRPRVRPDLAQLATTQFAEDYIRRKYGPASQTLREVFRLGDDLTLVATAASARMRSMKGLGRHRLPLLRPEDLPVRLPADADVAAALSPLVDPLLNLREQVLRHDADGTVITNIVDVRRLDSSARRLHMVLIAVACEAAKLDLPDVYDMVALSVCSGQGADSEDRRPDIVKARLDRWRYARRDAYKLRYSLLAAGALTRRPPRIT
jgi:hypothetical protein